MPIYEYRCKACAKPFEQLRSIRDSDKDVRCPDCRSDQVERKLSTFATKGGCSSAPGSRFT